MQTVSEKWESINLDRFCTKPHIIISIDSGDYATLISDEEITSYSVTKNGDLLSSNLTQDSINFVIHGIRDFSSFDNSDLWVGGLVSSTMTFEDYDGKSNINAIRGGAYYITSCKKQKTNEYAVSASSILAFMTEPCAAMDEPESGLEVVKNVIFQANLSPQVPSETIQIDVDEEALSAFDFQILKTDNYSLAQVLQLVANGCGCVLYVDRAGKIVIKPPMEQNVNYVLSEKYCYNPITVETADTVHNVRMISDHGNDIAFTNLEATGYGGTQVITNQILSDKKTISVVIRLYQMLNAMRKKSVGNCRINPAVDLFDLISVGHGDSFSLGYVTGFNATYTGSWKGTVEVTEYDSDSLTALFRIKDLEQLTLSQLESLRIKQITNSGT